MAIKRYFLTKNTTITNAFKSNLETRATGSNMGASDILEAFVIHGQTSASISAANAEQSRILLQFDVNNIISDISAGTLPSSSVDYVLKMFNAPHASTTPLSYSLDVAMVKSKAWQEGRGLDMDNYSDLGEANWVAARPSVNWSLQGGDYYGVGASGYSGSYFFDNGTENLELDLNFAISKWRNNPNSNYGLLVKNTDPVISGSDGTFFTKMFFGRTSEYFLKRPYVEARWDSTRKDNRGNVLVSSSLAPGSDNSNTLYLYNRIRGELKNIPGLTGDTLSLQIFSGSSQPTGSSLQLIDPSTGKAGFFLTGGLLIENGAPVSGVYTCSFASTLTGSNGAALTTGSYWDVWSTGSVQFHTGSFMPSKIDAQNLIWEDQYVTTITNLDPSYPQGSSPRVRIFARKKDWSPTIYTVATKDVVPEILDNAYYRVFRVADSMEVIPYGTGSSVKNYSRLSYDVSGNYFDLDTAIMDSGYMYGIQFAYYYNGIYNKQKEIFKFKIDDKLP
jgi:hypothetical protein